MVYVWRHENERKKSSSTSVEWFFLSFFFFAFKMLPLLHTCRTITAQQCAKSLIFGRSFDVRYGVVYGYTSAHGCHGLSEYVACNTHTIVCSLCSCTFTITSAGNIVWSETPKAYKYANLHMYAICFWCVLVRCVPFVLGPFTYMHNWNGFTRRSHDNDHDKRRARQRRRRLFVDYKIL